MAHVWQRSSDHHQTMVITPFVSFYTPDTDEIYAEFQIFIILLAPLFFLKYIVSL